MSFSDYELQGELARTGHSVLYRARNIATGRIVGVEVIHGWWYQQGPSLGRTLFRAKQEAVALLSHPNIVPVLELGETDRALYLVRPTVDVEYLDTRMRQARIPPREAVHWTEQLAGAVQHAHDHGIFHCDIKPGNVVLTAAGVPLLEGFDCAVVKFLHPQESEHGEGAIVGTPAYMAPEQATGKHPNFGPTVDVWGLGTLLYAMLTGQAPFQGPSALDTILAVINAEAPSPRTIEPGVDRTLEAICMKCLRKKPEERYADVAALADDLCRYQRGEAIESPQPESMSRRLGGWMRGWWGGRGE